MVVGVRGRHDGRITAIEERGKGTGPLRGEAFLDLVQAAAQLNVESLRDVEREVRKARIFLIRRRSNYVQERSRTGAAQRVIGKHVVVLAKPFVGIKSTHRPLHD